jgi:hypothetical protein
MVQNDSSMIYRKCIVRRLKVEDTYTFSVYDYTTNNEIVTGQIPALIEVGEEEKYIVGNSKVKGYRMLDPNEIQKYVDNGGFIEVVFHYDGVQRSLVPYYLNGKIIVKGNVA